MADAVKAADGAAKKSDDGKRPKQGRSPAYPAIPLEEAIKKTLALYNAEGKYAAPMPSAFKAWGFGEKSSGGRDVRAALKYFGLIALEGDGDTGKVKITEDALRVLLDEREDQSEKKAIIRRLALAPSVHQKLFSQFPEGIKSNPTAEHFLVFEMKYNKAAAGEVVNVFKKTADFAELYKPATVVVKEPPVTEDDDQTGDEGSGSAAADKPPLKPLVPKGQVKIMDGERVVFTEEGGPSQYLKLVASGEVDDVLLEALEDYVKRQRKRLKAAPAHEPGAVVIPGVQTD